MLAGRANAQKEGVDRSGWLLVGGREQRWDAVRCPRPDAGPRSRTNRQAKAGQPDAAFATYRRMLAAGAAPNSWTFSMLVSACGRGRQPARASEVVERLMPQVCLMIKLWACNTTCRKCWYPAGMYQWGVPDAAGGGCRGASTGWECWRPAIARQPPRSAKGPHEECSAFAERLFSPL